MPEVVRVSTIEKEQSLMNSIEENFKKGRYDEITQAVGMHSVLIDPEHMMVGQARLYRVVLNLLKNRISEKLGKKYAAWYSDFPKIVDRIVADEQDKSDPASRAVLSSHLAAYGPFKSVDEFFTWALDDRRLTLGRLVQFIERTTAAIC